ncbi:MAG: hypothetical protein R3F43_29425 [bacterium]
MSGTAATARSAISRATSSASGGVEGSMTTIQAVLLSSSGGRSGWWARTSSPVRGLKSRAFCAARTRPPAKSADRASAPSHMRVPPGSSGRRRRSRGRTSHAAAMPTTKPPRCAALSICGTDSESTTLMATTTTSQRMDWRITGGTCHR